MMYAVETMTLDRKLLKRVERHIFRVILGPVRITDNEFKKQPNAELNQEIKEEIVK